MRKTQEDIIIILTNTINSILSESRVETSLSELSTKSGLPNVVVARYLPIFERLGKISINETLSNRGVEREINISEFDLVVQKISR